MAEGERLLLEALQLQDSSNTEGNNNGKELKDIVVFARRRGERIASTMDTGAHNHDHFNSEVTSDQDGRHSNTRDASFNASVRANAMDQGIKLYLETSLR